MAVNKIEAAAVLGISLVTVGAPPFLIPRGLSAIADAQHNAGVIAQKIQPGESLLQQIKTERGTVSFDLTQAYVQRDGARIASDTKKIKALTAEGNAISQGIAPYVDAIGIQHDHAQGGVWSTGFYSAVEAGGLIFTAHRLARRLGSKKRGSEKHP